LPCHIPPLSVATRWAIALSASILCWTNEPLAADKPLVGDRHTVSVIDGDTLQIGGRIVQLAGIDAPEMGQICVHDDQDSHCGLRAAYALNKLIELAAVPVICAELVDGRTGVVEANCESRNENLSLTMLQSGYAVALPDTPSFYQDAQKGAQKASLGIWASRFVPPWAWRKGDRLPAEARWADKACVIHGKVAANGARLYYVPTDPAYNTITIDPSQGDRTFCSDEEARATGWRCPGQDPVSPVR
jgi:endonuclease YncB( thermonuclease family)